MPEVRYNCPEGPDAPRATSLFERKPELRGSLLPTPKKVASRRGSEKKLRREGRRVWQVARSVACSAASWWRRR
jgi:hypothetical protein